MTIYDNPLMGHQQSELIQGHLARLWAAPFAGILAAYPRKLPVKLHDSSCSRRVCSWFQRESFGRFEGAHKWLGPLLLHAHTIAYMRAETMTFYAPLQLSMMTIIIYICIFLLSMITNDSWLIINDKCCSSMTRFASARGTWENMNEETEWCEGWKQAPKFSWVSLKQCQWICLGWFWDFSILIKLKASNPFSRFPRRIRYGSRGSFGTWTGTRTVMRNDIQIQIDSMDSKRWGGPAKWWFQIWKRFFKLDHLLK